MNKRFLIISNSSDGLYGFRKELLASLKNLGEVFLSVPNSGHIEDLKKLGCTIIETPLDRRGINPIKDFTLLLRYIHIINQVKPTYVITYTIKPNIYGGLACRLSKTPFAANITGLGTTFQKKGIIRSLVTKLYSITIRHAKVVFFENISNLLTLVNLKIIREKQCCLLNGAGVNLQHYSFSNYPHEFKSTHFLFIGRVMAEKGVNELFAATKRLVDDGFNCKLSILGYYEENYKDIIDSFQKQSWLIYNGFQSDVRPFIENSHCFVLPSWHEGMANTNLEAASMGRPIITSNIHGCREAVINGKSGLLCEPKNANSLYETMKAFCELSYEEKKQMGIAGRRHMEEVFDKNKVVAETLKGLGL